MLSQVKFELKPRPHPYPDEPSSPLELWGRLLLVATADKYPVILCETEWDLIEFAEWFAEHQDAMCHERLIDDDGGALVSPDQSLAVALAQLQQREFDDDDAEERWFARLFEFRQRHVLTFALRGSRVPPITIGCNGTSGEVSLADGATTWSYQFSMSDFLADSQRSLRSLLEGTHTGARQRAERVLTRLNRMDRGCCSECQPEEVAG
jgi:hypothetical protein